MPISLYPPQTSIVAGGNTAGVSNVAAVGSEYGEFVRPILSDDVVGPTSITATDIVVAAPTGNGVLLSGASTAGSVVAVQSNGGDSAWIIQITGLTTGQINFEESLDSTNGTDGNWIAVNGRQTGITNTILNYAATTNGIYRGNTSGAKWLRARQTGTYTATPSIIIRISNGTGAIFLNASIPAGTNNIGITGLPFALSTTLSNLANSTINATALASNASRRGAAFYNDDTAASVYLKFGATASATSFTVKIGPGDYYELFQPIYTGQIDVLATAATGTLRITEVT